MSLRWILIPASMLALANAETNEDWWILSRGDAEGNAYLIDGIAKQELDSARSFNAHFFYRVPIDGVKSAQIEFYVDCFKGTLREARYIDFDERRVQLDAGDNFEINQFSVPTPGTIGDDFVRFACSNDAERSQRYANIDDDVDLWALGERLVQQVREGSSGAS